MSEDGIEDEDLINGWLSTLISDSGEGGHGEETEVDLPDESLWDHQEGEPGVADEASGPAIVGSMESAADLIEVVGGSHSPLPVIVLEDVIAVFKLSWVPVSLLWLESTGTSHISVEVEVIAVNRGRWLESLIIVTWVTSLSSGGLSWHLLSGGSEASHLSADERSLGDHGSS